MYTFVFASIQNISMVKRVAIKRKIKKLRKCDIRTLFYKCVASENTGRVINVKTRTVALCRQVLEGGH